MDNKILVTIIFSCCVDLVNSDAVQCTKIIKKKGFVDTIEYMRVRFQINRTDYCSPANKTWNRFTDAFALMCTKYLISQLEKSGLMNITEQYCGVNKIGYTDFRKCGSVDNFQNCINSNMARSLKSIASTDSYRHNACLFCNETSFLVTCVSKSQLNLKCPTVSRAILQNPFQKTMCRLCKSITCSEGKFGRNCSESCHCADNATCDSVTGRCLNGCHHRYYGWFCLKTCKPGLYLKHDRCERKCLCKNIDQCVVTNGTCLDDQCIAGSVEKNRVCSPCSKGKFGRNCSESCHCADNATCDSVTGWCLNGCHHRYYGWFCLKTCPDGWYLKSQGICNGKCLCTNINQCLVTSGECDDSQCIDGYIAVFKTCFVDVKNATIPVFLDNEIVRIILPQAMILFLIGFAVIVAALFAIFSGIYSRGSVPKMEQGVEPVTDLETPSKSTSRLANSRKGSMDKRRDSDDSSTASLSARGRKRSKRSQRKRKNKSSK